MYLFDGQDFAPGGGGPDVHHEDLLPLQLLDLCLLSPLLRLDAQQPPQEVEADLHLGGKAWVGKRGCFPDKRETKRRKLQDRIGGSQIDARR